MEIISRAEAKAKGLTRYFTGKPCPHGHVCERYCYSNGCILCLGIKSIPRVYIKISRDERNRRIIASKQKRREKDKRNAAALDTLAMLANLSKLKEMDNQ